jgi:transcriptional regulator of acetoin/glycerol metabolism
MPNCPNSYVLENIVGKFVPATNLKEKKDGIEKEHYEKVLEVFGGNVTSTAKSMGISRSTMYRKMKNHGIKHIRKLK